MVGQVIRSEHVWLLFDHVFVKNAGACRRTPWHQDLPRLPDIEAEREKWNIVAFDIEPGVGVLLHPGVLHGGGHTSEGRQRRTLSVRL
jgi:hypothetical protein